MVLRSGLDMVNFCQVVLGFKPDLASKVLGEHASLVVERGQNRKCGKVKNEIVTFAVVRGDEVVGGVEGEGHEFDAEEQEAENDDDDDDDDKTVEKHEKDEEVDNEQNKHSLKGNDLHVGVNSKSSHDDDDDDDVGFMKFS
jgi:hypothetical protein